MRPAKTKIIAYLYIIMKETAADSTNTGRNPLNRLNNKQHHEYDR